MPAKKKKKEKGFYSLRQEQVEMHNCLQHELAKTMKDSQGTRSMIKGLGAVQGKLHKDPRRVTEDPRLFVDQVSIFPREICKAVKTVNASAISDYALILH